MPDLDGIETFCNALMTGVAASGALNDDNLGRAVQIMRDEAKAFFTSGKYADERTAIVEGSVNTAYVIASVVASCVLKLTERST